MSALRCLAWMLAAIGLHAQIQLSSSPNPSKFGQPVTLTATVSPAGATGPVTFYNGATILGIAAVKGGAAQFHTALLPAGTQSLWAWFSGVASRPILQTVNATPATGFTVAPGNSLADGTFTASLVAGDFNGDGHVDAAFISDSIGGAVTVLLGDGNGGLTPAGGSPFGLGIKSPQVMVAGDFNGDGNTDLAIEGIGIVTIFLGDGTGRFTVASTLGASSTIGPALAVGDFNADGRADLAIGGGDGTVSIFLGDGAGGFTPASGSPYAVAVAVSDLAIGDFNGDGHADIAVAAGYLTLLLGDGAGGFTPAAGTPVFASFLAVADWNGDGKSDLAALDRSAGSLTIFIGDATRGLVPASGGPYPAGNYPGSLVAGDFNGDGKLDVAIAAQYRGDLRVFIGDGTGRLTPGMGTPLSVGSNPLSLAVADFNGDGRSDLAVLTPGALLLALGSTAPEKLKFTAQPTDGVTGTPLASVTVEVQDANGNVVTSANPVVSLTTGLSNDQLQSQTAVNGVATFRNLVFNSPGSRTLTASALGLSTATSTPFEITAPASQLTFRVQPSATLGPVVVEVRDSVQNVVAASNAAVTLTSMPAGFSATVAAVDGVATFPGLVFAPGTYTLTATSPGLASAISFPFLTAQASTATTLSALPAAATFGKPVTLTATVTPSAAGVVTFYDGATVLGTAPLNTGRAQMSTILLPAGQRQLHAVYGGEAAHLPSVSATVVQTVKANAASSFLAAVGSPFAVGKNPGPVIVADFNGDGKPDVAVLNLGSNSVSVLLGGGANASQFSTGQASVIAMVAGDFNGDGKTDLAIAGQANNTGDGGSVVLLLGNGSGGFATGGTFVLPHRPTSAMVASDFNGDGRTDLLLGYFFGFGTTNRVTFQGTAVLLGDGAGGFVQVGDLGVSGSMVVADFNGDRIPDLAIATGTRIDVWLGNGAGGFTPAAGVLSGFSPSSPLAAADFDGDGKIDLAVAGYVLFGDGAGGFQAASNTGPAPQSMAVGDFNGDGIPDLATVGNLVTILLGNGSGGFQVGYQSSMGVGAAPAGVAVGDFNGDGKQDLAITNSGANSLTLLLGTDAGPAARLRFSVPPANQSVGSTMRPVSVEVQDANGTPSSATVTLTSSPAGVSARAAAVNGVATFSQLVFTRPGVYTLTASSPGLASVVSESIAIAPVLPIAGGAVPRYGNGFTQTFAFRYFSQGGADWLSDVRAVVNSTLAPTNACYVEYVRASNTLYLFNDSYTGLAGQLVMGSTGTMSNSQCTVDGRGSSVTAAANELTLNLSITFAQSFLDPKTIWGLAIDQGNLNSGWVQTGMWTPGPETALRFAAQPAGGPAGAPIAPIRVQVVNALGAVVTGSHALVTLNSSVPGVAPTQAAVNGVATFTGLVIPTPGSYRFNAISPGLAPALTDPIAIGAVAPTADSAAPNFVFQYSSPSGATWLSDVRVLVNSDLSPVNACYVQYAPLTKTLYLFNDAYTALAGQVVAGTSGTASNGQCTIRGTGSSASLSGHTLTLSLAVSFAASFTGPKGIWSLAVDRGGLNSGWAKWGTWVVTP